MKKEEKVEIRDDTIAKGDGTDVDVVVDFENNGRLVSLNFSQPVAGVLFTPKLAYALAVDLIRYAGVVEYRQDDLETMKTKGEA